MPGWGTGQAKALLLAVILSAKEFRALIVEEVLRSSVELTFTLFTAFNEDQGLLPLVLKAAV